MRAMDATWREELGSPCFVFVTEVVVDTWIARERHGLDDVSHPF